VTDHNEDSNITNVVHCINNACLAAVVWGTEKQYPGKYILLIKNVNIINTYEYLDFVLRPKALKG
jgi:hypothetical protein